MNLYTDSICIGQVIDWFHVYRIWSIDWFHVYGIWFIKYGIDTLRLLDYSFFSPTTQSVSYLVSPSSLTEFMKLMY